MAVLKTIQNTQEIKKRFLIGRNRTKRAHFRGSPLFQGTYNIKTEKHLIQLILCQLGVGGWQVKRAWDWVSFVPFSFHQPPTSNWHKRSWINCLFFCFLVVRTLKKRTSSKICTFCLVLSNQKVFLSSLVCFGSFFKTLAVNSDSDFFFF